MANETIALERRRTRGVWVGSAVGLSLVLVAAAAGATWLGGDAHPRFLDLPLGAYLAGQGALMAGALACFRIAGETRGDG